MILRVIPLDFRRDFDRSGAVAIPKDPTLYRMLEQFTEQNFVDKPNYADGYVRCWVAVEVDPAERPVSVQGVIGYQMQADVTLLRSLTPQALVRLTARLNSFFADNGARGFPVLVYLNPQEDERQKCPKIQETLKAWNAVPANRYVVTVR